MIELLMGQGLSIVHMLVYPGHLSTKLSAAGPCLHVCAHARVPRSPFHRAVNSRASDRDREQRDQHPSILSALDQSTAKQALRTPRYAGQEGEASRPFLLAHCHDLVGVGFGSKAKAHGQD